MYTPYLCNCCCIYIYLYSLKTLLYVCIKYQFTTSTCTVLDKELF